MKSFPQNSILCFKDGSKLSVVGDSVAGGGIRMSYALDTYTTAFQREVYAILSVAWTGVVVEYTGRRPFICSTQLLNTLLRKNNIITEKR